MIRSKGSAERRRHERIYWLRSLLAGLLISVACSIDLKAQDKFVLAPEEFISQVKQYHPVSRQAGLLVEKASAALLSARGNFDPIFEMNHDEKTFSGTNYYNYSNPELKIPTIAGVTIKSGLENTNGQNIDPELTTGRASYIGIEVPLLKGLWTDKHRAALQQARIFVKQSRHEQANMVNDLIYEAYNAYWMWAGAHQLFSIYSKYSDLAERRLSLVRVAFENGDRSAGDTTEAFSQLQYYRMLQNDAAIQMNTRYNELSVFLWNEKGEPYLLSERYIPDILSFNRKRNLPPVDAEERRILVSHPMLSAYKEKRNSLEVERKLKWQNLLPTVNLRANMLSKGYFDKINLAGQYLDNNYKFGFTIKTPLLLRQARGEYRESKLKVKENDLAIAYKSWELQSKLRKYHYEVSLIEQQIDIATHARENIKKLLSIEDMKFSQGEGSLFLVNSRENKLLEMDQKLVELYAKYARAYNSFNWVAGNFR